jgi:hypothetical protein
LDAAATHRLATEILRERRFHPASVPRPLHGVLHALGKLLAAPGHAISSLVGKLSLVLPGGAVSAWILVVALVAAAIALAARRYSRSALAGGTKKASFQDAAREMRAADLERAALEAEREGRFAEAVRLRFRAGLERLGEHGTISGPRSTPTAEVARRLRSSHFDLLARRHDEIAYGAAAAEAHDAEHSRDGWREVIRAAERG